MSDYWDDPVDESNPFLTYYVGVVKESFWSNLGAETEGKVHGEGADETKLFWHVQVLDILDTNFGGTPPETLTINFSIGKKWWSDPENPDVVEHEDDSPDADSPKKFNPQSQFGRILQLVAGKSAEDALGDYKVQDGGPELEVAFKGVAEHFRKVGAKDARNSRIWEGLIFGFRGIGFAYTDSDRKKTYGKAKAFPVMFMGTDITAVDKPAEEEVVVDSPWLKFTDPPDPSTAKTLDTLAAKSKDHETFVKNALMLPAVKANQELADAVADPSNYVS